MKRVQDSFSHCFVKQKYLNIMILCLISHSVTGVGCNKIHNVINVNNVFSNKRHKNFRISFQSFLILFVICYRKHVGNIDIGFKQNFVCSYLCASSYCTFRTQNNICMKDISEVMLQ